MNNLSFFKLPAIFTAIFWFISSIIPMILQTINHQGYQHFGDYMVTLIYTLLIYDIPKILLIFFVASLTLYRCNINQVTVKNIIYLTIISCVGSVVIVWYYMFLFSAILGYLYKSMSHYFYQIIPYFSDTIFIFFTNIITELTICLIIGLICYYGILLLKNAFDRDVNSTDINCQNSANISIKLFMILFMFTFIFFWGNLLLSFIRVYFYQERYIYLIIYLITMIIFAFVFYFSIYKSFSAQFENLPISLVIKSVMLSFVRSAIVNILIIFVMIFCFVIIIFGSHRGSDIKMGLVMLVGGGLQLLFTCIIMRSVCRCYFTKKMDQHESLDMTIP